LDLVVNVHPEVATIVGVKPLNNTLIRLILERKQIIKPLLLGRERDVVRVKEIRVVNLPLLIVQLTEIILENVAVRFRTDITRRLIAGHSERPFLHTIISLARVFVVRLRKVYLATWELCDPQFIPYCNPGLGLFALSTVGNYLDHSIGSERSVL